MRLGTIHKGRLHRGGRGSKIRPILWINQGTNSTTKMRTRGRVKNPEDFADVLYEWSLISSVIFIHPPPSQRGGAIRRPLAFLHKVRKWARPPLYHIDHSPRGGISLIHPKEKKMALNV